MPSEPTMEGKFILISYCISDLVDNIYSSTVTRKFKNLGDIVIILV